MLSLYDRLLLMWASINASKALIDTKEKDSDAKMKKLRYKNASIIDKLIKNVAHIFHQYWIFSQYNGV